MTGTRLEEPLGNLKGIGKNRVELLRSLGIETVRDLLFYFPFRYDDFRFRSLREMRREEPLSIRGVVASEPMLRYYTKKKSRLAVIVETEEMPVTAVWFNQPYMKERLQPGKRLFLFGKYDPLKQQIVVSETSFNEEKKTNRNGLQPVYSVSGSVSVKWLRGIIEESLRLYGEEIEEILPDELVTRYRLMDRREAVRNLHFPPDETALALARRRMVYEELFLFQLKLQAYKRINKAIPDGTVHRFPMEKIEEFIRNLPFPLTNAQRRVIDEILSDMRSPYGMNRLLQGDVGSGKTVVAAVALYAAVLAGYQAAFMVPTEILAEQHYRTLKELLEPQEVTIALLSGNISAGRRRDLLGEVALGWIDILVGTHALIQEDVSFHSLGLVITDEQHRFGVRQRKILREKGKRPDILFMTATPIPRTLAITAFGDMEISTLDEMPAGRKPVTTEWTVPERWDRVCALLRQEMEKGRQAYVISPLIEESEKMDLANATDLYMKLVKTFPQFRVGLMHGRLPSKEKDDVMSRFVKGEIDLLVSTTVVEVGVNVPNATVMVIVDADRFGLAQLHQLRGRVGRGGEKSYCILIADAKSETARERMNVMRETHDGFEIARRDLELRGPGDFFGTKQSGLPDFRLADLTSSRDFKILEIAREDAARLLETDSFWTDPAWKKLRHYLKKEASLEEKILD
ncbi:branch migrating ATP-dependent DNA helicase involved in DNA recombination and repair [[Clostridium] ultunense Esp]|nr:branch migrating ATP-dependent DNA helicase involved in DNA recombination and repair [[Clostridium] ultunense Esp]